MSRVYKGCLDAVETILSTCVTVVVKTYSGGKCIIADWTVIEHEGCRTVGKLRVRKTRGDWP